MKILAIDFSSGQRSVAVACGKVHVREVIDTSPGKAMKPFAMIESALEAASLTRAEVECIAVGLGPGSYTGIRAGIALAQGWQLATGLKLLGISSSEAIAVQAQSDCVRGAVSVVVDAQRGEFYLATWELTEETVRELEPLRIVGREAIDSINDRPLIGPEVTKWFPRGHLVHPRAATIAALASTRSDFIPGEKLEPIYLRETTFVKAPPPRAV
jgi:tRNA threonylcarbamoyl adenosine modification protein YeaZ